VGDATYADGTNFNAISYFLNISYKLDDAHKLAFNVFGAKQRHGQRQDLSLISDYRASERGARYNPDWGFKNGQVVNIEDNFYHKPLASLNHYWRINDNSTLSTSLYGSTGSGGGGGTAGAEQGKLQGELDGESYRIGNFGPIDVDRIVAENIDNGANGASAILRASRNDHVWVGALSVFNTELSDRIDLNVGADYRFYVGEHFQEVTDLLGGQYYFENRDVNNPNSAYLVGDKINYHDKGYHRYIGFFGQAEYDYDNFSAFVAANYNNSAYQREDFFAKLDNDPAQLTDIQSFNGFGGKLGGNYRININGLEALHQGVEIDFEYRPLDFLTLTGMVSIGDWTWNNNVTDVPFFDVDRNIVIDEATGLPETTDIYLEGIPVGRSAQTTSALGVKVKLSDKTTFVYDYNFYDRYYADFNLQARNSAQTLETKPWRVPSFALSDVILRHEFEFGSFNASIVGRIYNLFDSEFINRAQDGNTSSATDALVFIGQGRTFSISTRINF